VPTANEALLDANIAHAIGLERYSLHVQRKIIALLNRVDADLVDQIRKNDAALKTGYSADRLKAMLDTIRTINANAYRAIKSELNGEVRALGLYAAEFQVRAITTVAPVVTNMVVPSSATLYAAAMARPFQGALLKEVFAGMEQAAFGRVRNAIRMGYVEGETTDRIVRRIVGTRSAGYRDGITEINRKSAIKVVRTALSHTANVARDETYKENSAVIKALSWVSTLDGRTTQICRDRDGKQYTLAGKPIGHSLPYLSGPGRAHWQCRSSSFPVLKSWKEMGINLKEAPAGTRASLDGQVPAKTTYYEWLAAKPASFQNGVLGKGRGKLFRGGKLPPERFTDRSGKAYTLDQLRQREAKAWERAGL